jgi:hypothetical protein
MSTLSIIRRPIPIAAGVAAVAVLGLAGATVAQGHHDSPVTGDLSQHTRHHGDFHPVGGRIQLGLP